MERNRQHLFVVLVARAQELHLDMVVKGLLPLAAQAEPTSLEVIKTPTTDRKSKDAIHTSEDSKTVKATKSNS